MVGCRCEQRSQSDAEIVIDLGVSFQAFEGFGTSINAWFPDVRAYCERPEFARFFTQELGATVVRVDLHGDVVPQREQAEELSYRDFLLEGAGERGAVYLNVAAALARAAPGELRVIASVWSPPSWMKVNGTNGNGHTERRNFALSASDLGLPPDAEEAKKTPDQATRERYLLSNELRPDRYAHFAKSLVEWVRLYRAHGVELYALSAQNEPRFSHWFGSAVYTPEELTRVLEEVVRTFAREGETLPRLFAPETMMQDSAGNRAYIDALLASDVVAPHLHALAVHGYVDGYETDLEPKSPALFFEVAGSRGRAIWVTEGGTGGHDWPAALNGFGTSMTNALTRGHAALITPWQVVDREATTHGLSTLSGPTKKTALAQQFFRFFRPGMRRVQATSSASTLSPVAMLQRAQSGREDGLALYVANRGKQAQRTRVRLTDGSLTLKEARITDRERSFAPLKVEGPMELVIPSESAVSFRFRVSPR